MATKSTKKSAAKKTAGRQWQKTVAHVVEAALESAGGRGMTVDAIVRKTGLKQAQAERHLTYMTGKLDGYILKNPRATVKAGVYRLIDGETGSFRGESWIDDARERFVPSKRAAAARKKAKKA